MEGCVEGIKTMMPANIILVLAWTISGVCRDLLQTPQFVETVVTGGSLTAALLPAVVFAIAAFLSFSTGTAWGTFGILIPIVVPVAQALEPELLVVSLSATLAGSVFGDHCSPISDTTILSSAGSGCNHVEHVSTQLGLCPSCGELLSDRVSCCGLLARQPAAQSGDFSGTAARYCDWSACAQSEA